MAKRRKRSKRRLNPTPTQWAMMGVAGALVLGLSGAAVAAATRRKKKDLPGVVDTPDPPPPPVVEPPVQPPPVQPQSLEWVLRTAKDPGYPWAEPVLHYENYPTPSMFVDIGDSDGAWNPASGFDSLVKAILASALAMAGNDPKIAFAQGQDANAQLGKDLRRKVRESLIVVGGFNDLNYGQTNLNYAGGNDPNAPGGDPNKPLSATYVLNAQKRGLNWLPRHADNIDRIQASQASKRTTTLQGKKLSPPNSGNRHMVVWAPAYDLDALGPDKAVPTIKFLTWPDGSSTLHPPPQIRALGIDMSGVQLPGV